MRAIVVAFQQRTLPMKLRVFSLLLTLLYTVVFVPLLHRAHFEASSESTDEGDAPIPHLPLSTPGRVAYLKASETHKGETSGRIQQLQVAHSKAASEESNEDGAVTGRVGKTRVEPDGSFNGFDLFKVDEPPHTDIHCVGENFQEEESYRFRSCRFETFCFDTRDREFVVYPDRPINGTMYGEIYSSTHNPENYTDVVPGAMNRNWWPIYWNDKDGMKSRVGKYHPKFVYADSGNVPTSYYRFDATWLPFYRHQRSAYNPGHLVWDDFLALYTLLDIFDQGDDTFMLSHMVRKAVEDFSGDEDLPDSDIIGKFLPLLGEHPYDLQTLEGEYELKLKDANGALVRRSPSGKKKKRQRHIICADNGLLGNGMFTDNGDQWHGDIESDYDYPQNNGRGGHFRRYREWMMKHIGVDHRTPIQRDPYLIVVSQSSSTKADRRKMKFKAQIEALEKIPNSVVKSVQLSKLSLVEQVELLSRTAVFISSVGGGTMTGTFLPKGASIVLYMPEERALDFDFWNNFPQLKTHWFPLENMTEAFYVQALVETVEKQFEYLGRH